MTNAIRASIGIPEQRGFWLRCFLGAIMFAALLLVDVHAAQAQLDVPKPERLTHVEGMVVDPDGNPMPDLPVKLLQNDKVVAETRTGKSGEFQFEHVSGTYVFHVDRTKYAPAARDIVVTNEIVTHLERKKLYVILGPGACQDACSAVITSKKEFDRTIRKNRHHD